MRFGHSAADLRRDAQQTLHSTTGDVGGAAVGLLHRRRRRTTERPVACAMRDLLGVNERLFARWYPMVAGMSENAGQSDTRGGLVANASGRTLEIGAGSGYNLPHFTDAVSQLVVSEPSPHMLRLLRERLESAPPPVTRWDLVQTGAERLPFADSRFDTVVGAFVHCTISDPVAALVEVARVLRPGGRYLFLEHVRAADGSALGLFQDLVELPHRYVAAGCHPNRRIESLLQRSPLRVERLVRGRQPRAFPTVRPTIMGCAVRD